ncbi:hypothetical protein [Reyranella sp.]|uniref:hypothetical protein n=1 Tax=Reyranella sp. TaxID=1929291 RepID=UPI003BA97F73
MKRSVDAAAISLLALIALGITVGTGVIVNACGLHRSLPSLDSVAGLDADTIVASGVRVLVAYDYDGNGQRICRQVVRVQSGKLVPANCP